MPSKNGTGICSRGHVLTPENTYRSASGISVECRICRRARKAAYKKRKAAEARGERPELAEDGMAVELEARDPGISDRLPADALSPRAYQGNGDPRDAAIVAAADELRDEFGPDE